MGRSGSDPAAGPRLRPDGRPVRLTGTVGPGDAGGYLVRPFRLDPGAGRIEVSYWWDPEHDTVFDLGLWEGADYRRATGFRGWSGSRQGRRHLGQPPVWIEATAADRCFRPGPLAAGPWWVELGVAGVAQAGARWTVELRAGPGPAGAAPAPDPVEAGHVARSGPGWYHGDFHQHGFHSNPGAPEWEELVERSRAAGLDILPVIEYVVGWHWDELGPLARRHDDLLFWPGREVITYYGHAVTLGETPGVVEYRHGFEDVTLGGIQADAVGAGALFQIAHPTTYPVADFGNTCRGCEFRLGDAIDWSLVDTLEVVTGPVALGDPPVFPNPFVDTALALWHERLRAGYRITAVSGSDDKLGPGYGSSATAVHASELSRPAIAEALRAGRAYVRTRGVRASPELELVASAPDGSSGSFGSRFDADRAEVTVTVRGGAGQELRVLADGEIVDRVPLGRDDATHTFVASSRPDPGPLGTFWTVETRDAVSVTTIGNPVFLAGSGR